MGPLVCLKFSMNILMIEFFPTKRLISSPMIISSPLEFSKIAVGKFFQKSMSWSTKSLPSDKHMHTYHSDKQHNTY